jgi:hypothetical protein
LRYAAGELHAERGGVENKDGRARARWNGREIVRPRIRKMLEDAENSAVLADPLQATRQHATTVSLIDPVVAMTYAAKPFNTASTTMTTAAPFSDWAAERVFSSKGSDPRSLPLLLFRSRRSGLCV